MIILNFPFLVLIIDQVITPLNGCYVWPMVSYNIGGRHDKSIEISNPKINDVFEVCREDVLHSKETMVETFLNFTGERRRYVDTVVEPNKEYDKSFYIGMFFKPAKNRGTLFHYRANSNTDDIKEIKIELEDGLIKVNMSCETRFVCVSHLVSTSETLPWKFGLVRFDMGDSKTELNGIGCIGASLGNPIGEFVGVFQCIAILPKKDKTSPEKIYEKCNYKEIQHKFEEKKKYPRPYTNVEVKSIWPLNNRSCGFEAKHMVRPLSIPGSCNSWTTGNFVIVGLDEATVATLSSTKLIKTEFTDDVMYSRFSIAMFVFVSNVPNNTSNQILQIHFPKGYFKSLTVKIFQNEHVNVSLSTTETISNQIGDINDWHFIAVQYNHDWNELSLIIDDKFFNTKVLLNDSNHFTTSNVELEIGGFDGNIACVAIFNTPLSENTASDLLKRECNKEKIFNAPAEDTPTPVKIWPLRKQTMGFEMNSGQPLMRSPMKLCWRFNKGKPTDLIDSEAVQFYGVDQFSLSVDPVATSDIFVIGVFVKTVDISGTILKVNFTSGSVELTMERGNLSLVINGIPCLNIPWIYNNEWVSVVLEFNGGQVLLNIEDNDIQHSCGLMDQTSQATLQLGGTTESFIGEMRCLEIFNASIITTGSAKSVLKVGCSESNSYKPDLGQASPVTASNIWRLDKTTISSNKQIHGMELLNSNQSVYFDGSSRLHLLINISIPNGDMSLGFFFKPMPYSKGVILQDKSSEFRISIDDHKIVIYTGSSCDFITYTGITNGEWHWLMIIRITSCRSLIFVLDGEIKYAHAECFEKSGLVELRLGGEVKSFNNFRGDVSCLSLFNTVVDWDIGNDSMVQSCNGYLHDEHFEVEQNRDEVLSINKFDLIATNSVPSDQSGIINEFNVKSAIFCSRICSTTKFCRSYNLYTTDAFNLCTLFDFITIDGLKYYTNTKYYGMLY